MDAKKEQTLAIYLGIPLGILLLGLVGLGLLTMTDYLPSTEVLMADQVSEQYTKTLRENEVLYEDEQIEYFYSEGLISILEGGSILTNRAVVAYGQDEKGEMEVYEIVFSKIVSVELEEEGDFLNDAVYKVIGDEEDLWVRLILSTENDGHLKFIDALQIKINQLAQSGS